MSNNPEVWSDDLLSTYDGITRTLDCKYPCYCMRLGARDGYITFRLLTRREAAFVSILMDAESRSGVIRLVASRCILDSKSLTELHAGSLASVVSLIIEWSFVRPDLKSVNDAIVANYNAMDTIRRQLELQVMTSFPYTLEDLEQMDGMSLVRAVCYAAALHGTKGPPVLKTKKLDFKKANAKMGFDGLPETKDKQIASERKKRAQNARKKGFW